MKYIRTKNGEIIAFLNEDRETKLPNRDLRFYFTKPDKVIAFIGKDEIIKQANTIEELCDEFVVVSGNMGICVFIGDTLIRAKDFVFERRINKSYYKGAYEDIIYGAIWTDKGLIYVAKMNEKGELELL